MDKLKPGEKYLSIKLTGHDYVVAFRNRAKQKSNEPDYKGDGVAVWIREKKEPQTQQQKQNVKVESIQ